MQKQAFISWSGPSARTRAVALKGLLGDVLPEASIFMSDRDIPAGSLWLDEVTKALDASVAGVILVTRENLSSTWLHFEAGALATRVEKRMVIPVLSGLSAEDLNSSPLASFQALTMTAAHIKQVCSSFAEALDIGRAESALDRMFNKWWPDYEEALLSSDEPAPVKVKPTIEDLHQGILALQSFAKSQSEAIARLLNRSSDIAAGIVGQGPLATASAETALGLLRNELFPTDVHLRNWLAHSPPFDRKRAAEVLNHLRQRKSEDDPNEEQEDPKE